MTESGRFISLARAISVAWEEIFPQGDLRLRFVQFGAGLLPDGMFSRSRSRVYGMLGVRVGRSTMIAGRIRLGIGSRPENLSVGRRCYLNAHIRIDASDRVTIGDFVTIGHDVMIITSGHHIGPAECRGGIVNPKPVTIENGAWICAGAMLLPGINIGSGSIVAAGAVVTKDVPANTLVAGVPAKVVRAL